jgi:hypothetical protein
MPRGETHVYFMIFLPRRTYVDLSDKEIEEGRKKRKESNCLYFSNRHKQDGSYERCIDCDIRRGKPSCIHVPF